MTSPLLITVQSVEGPIVFRGDKAGGSGTCCCDCESYVALCPNGELSCGGSPAYPNDCGFQVDDIVIQSSSNPSIPGWRLGVPWNKDYADGTPTDPSYWQFYASCGQSTFGAGFGFIMGFADLLDSINWPFGQLGWFGALPQLGVSISRSCWQKSASASLNTTVWPPSTASTSPKMSISWSSEVTPSNAGSEWPTFGQLGEWTCTQALAEWTEPGEFESVYRSVANILSPTEEEQAIIDAAIAAEYIDWDTMLALTVMPTLSWTFGN